MHIESKLNPANIGTRIREKLDEPGPSSVWQRGPGFLLLPREWRPVSALVEGEAPKEELRKHHLDVWKDLHAADRREDQMEGLADAALGGRPEAASRAAGTDAPRTFFWKGTNLPGRQELSQTAAQGALARRLRVGGSDREKVRIEPTPGEREAARKLQLLAFSGLAREALEEGKPLSVGAQHKSKEGQGTVVVDG